MQRWSSWIGHHDNFSNPILAESQLSNESVIRKVIVVTSWRSGSTLLGEILNSVPGSFYSYEPLSHVDIHRVYSGDPLVASAVTVLNGILTCNFSLVVDEYKKHRKDFFTNSGGELITRNKALKPYCKSKASRKTGGICSSPRFLDKVCRSSRLHIVKTVRLGLDVAASLMARDPLLKVIYLARDPRGLLNSRLEREWCVETPLCINPLYICRDLLKDYWTAHRLSQTDKQFMVQRYEDFSLDIWNRTADIFNRFLDLKLHANTKSFLRNHTQSENYQHIPGWNAVWNTFRNPKETPFHWRDSLSFEQIQDVQSHCESSMEVWGYQMLLSEEDVHAVPILKTLEI